MSRSILVTGAAGSLGRAVVRRLADSLGEDDVLVATDLREPDPGELPDRALFVPLDIRDPRLAELVREHAVDVVVHLAAVVRPRPGQTREELHDIDVGGTERVLEACAEAGVGKLVYTSSGAAYGYRPDNPPLLRETDALRGNEVFAYAWHKRLIEELLAGWRRDRPELKQLVLRVSTVLGPDVRSPITALFERPLVTGIAGVASPFCLVWDEDVADCIVRGALGDGEGIYNLTGDGVLTLREIADGMGRRYLALPARALRAGLRLARRAGLTQMGPENVLFLAHRPVLCNEKLKRELGFVPRLSSREVFDLYREARA